MPSTLTITIESPRESGFHLDTCGSFTKKPTKKTFLLPPPQQEIDIEECPFIMDPLGSFTKPRHNLSLVGQEEWTIENDLEHELYMLTLQNESEEDTEFDISEEEMWWDIFGDF